MKYSSILAGVFGLMALAACTNNDEVKMDHPKEALTLKVAIGNGADTRLAFLDFDAEEGIKTEWEKDKDMIGLVEAGEDGADVGPGTTVYSFKAQESGNPATFVSEGTEPADGIYLVGYPKDFLINGFTCAEQSGAYEDLKNFVILEGETKIENGKFTEEVEVFSPMIFLRIPAGTVFGDIYGKGESGYAILAGPELYNAIDFTKPEDDRYVEGSIRITMADDIFSETATKEVYLSKDFYIAVPRFDAITQLTLEFVITDSPTSSTRYKYAIVTDESASDDDYVFAKFMLAGKVYTIEHNNLKLIEMISNIIVK